MCRNLFGRKRANLTVFPNLHFLDEVIHLYYDIGPRHSLLPKLYLLKKETREAKSRSLPVGL